MIVLNFSHPIATAQREAISNLSGYRLGQNDVKDIETQFDYAKSFAEQVVMLVESVGLTSEQWQTEQILVNLPSFNVIAALLLAELHGRMGHFPTVLRFRPSSEDAPAQFEPTEIINLQAIRDAARGRR